MKKLIIPALALMLILSFSSCVDDIDLPYVDPVDKFVGDWFCEERSQLYGESTFNVEIKKDPTNSAQVLIVNFYHFGNDIETFAIPTTSTITIPEQYVCNHTVKGTGFLSNNVISWEYIVDDGADIDTVAATYTRVQ